jgi:hypothetical protein
LSYEDDAAFMVLADTPAQCYSKIKATTKIAIDSFAAHALIPNLDPGKTECAAKLRGIDAKQANNRTHIQNDSTVKISNTLMGEVRLVVKHEYKHLGGVVNANSTMCREASMRISSMLQTCKPLEKIVFAEPSIDEATRMSSVNTLSHTTTFYNAGTWSWWMSPRGLDMLRNAVTRILKTVSHMHSSAEVHWREDQMYDELNAPIHNRNLRRVTT